MKKKYNKIKSKFKQLKKTRIQQMNFQKNVLKTFLMRIAF